jgi:hypothetical protein
MILVEDYEVVKISSVEVYEDEIVNQIEIWYKNKKFKKNKKIMKLLHFSEKRFNIFFAI